MAISNSPFGSTDFTFMAQAALAASRQSSGEDRETLAENYSAKLDAFTASHNAQLAELEHAQAQALAAQQAAVVMPDVSLEASTAMSSDADDLAAVLAELEGATVPPELEQQWQLAMAGLQQAIDFQTEGQNLFAQQARESWLPIATELMMEIDAPRAHADRNLTGDMAALLEATVATGGAPPSDEEIAATLAELGFMPASAYFDGDPRVPPIGNGFFGVGDFGRTGQDSIYEWLPQMVALRASESTQGHYLLASSEEVTTVEQHLRAVAEYEITHEGEITDDNGTHVGEVTEHLSYDEVIGELAARGLSAVEITAYLDTHERFLIAPAVVQSEGGDTPATYVGRAQYLATIGLPADVPLDLQIAFNNSGSGEGDAWLDRTHADGSVDATGYPQRAYHALVNDQLAADWVQIGDIGPLGDDIGKMLGEIYEKYGADTPEKQEAIKNALFKYDERFGVMANREFIEAAVETNNSRRQGFFEGPVGRALLMVAASFLPGGQYISMALSAGFSLHDGASFGEALRGAAVSYFAAEFGNSVGEWVQTNFGSALTPEVARTLIGAANNLGATAFRQLVTSGRLDGDALLMAAASGGLGSYVTSFVGDSDFGRALDAQFGAGRTGTILGSLAAASADGRLTPEDFIGAFSAGRGAQTSQQDGVTTIDEAGLQITRIDNEDGTYVFVRQGDEIYARNPDGSILRTYLGDDGQPVGAAYGDDGELVWQSNDLAALSGGAGASAPPDPAEVLRQAEERYATMFASGEATAEDLAFARADIISAQLAAGVTLAEAPEFSLSFREAFALARANGEASFEWTNPRDGVTRSYAAVTEEEFIRASDAYRAYVQSGGDPSIPAFQAHQRQVDPSWDAAEDARNRRIGLASSGSATVGSASSASGSGSGSGIVGTGEFDVSGTARPGNPNAAARVTLEDLYAGFASGLVSAAELVFFHGQLAMYAAARGDDLTINQNQRFPDDEAAQQARNAADPQVAILDAINVDVVNALVEQARRGAGSGFASGMANNAYQVVQFITTRAERIEACYQQTDSFILSPQGQQLIADGWTLQRYNQSAPSAGGIDHMFVLATNRTTGQTYRIDPWYNLVTPFDPKAPENRGYVGVKPGT